MSFFARVFRKDGGSKKKQNGASVAGPAKPQWTDAWLRTEVNPEEVQELLRGCTQELKARALDTPFLLLPFRPTSDPSAARTFVRNYFNPPPERAALLRGDNLMQELRLTEPMVLCSVMKWCWSRLPGGIVTWEAYELFKVGEQDSQLARDAFSTFIPISVDSDARTKIIFDFFDLLAAIAAHGKKNGLGGRKLSRYAGWWAFEHTDAGKGFEASYKTWTNAADATSHLFFAYLRSLSPDSIRGTNGIATLPLSLQTLVQGTEYPPESPSLLQTQTTKVVMIVDTVSPTPFALLRRAKNFEYRDSDTVLKSFAGFEDPAHALSDECRRVLRCISTTNQSEVSTTKASTSLRDASWSRFEDIGFGGSIEESEDEELPSFGKPPQVGLRSAPASRTADLGRPTTPSWADFLSTGFTDEQQNRSRAPLLLPPDKVLPPIQTVRGQSSQSHKRSFDQESTLDPGELASISILDLDDSFWWVWISSLAGEEPASRKAVFGRCALLETIIAGGKWLILEEQVKGAAPEPDAGAYIVEKKSFFGFRTRKGRLARRRSAAKKNAEPYKSTNNTAPMSRTSIGPDQHARIQAAAAALQRKHREQEEDQARATKSMQADSYSARTNSVLTLQPSIMNEASHAMKWASNYDKSAVRAAYLGNTRAGTGIPAENLDIGWNGKSPTNSTFTTDQEPTVPPKDGTRAVPEPVSAAPPPPPSKEVQPERPKATQVAEPAPPKQETGERTFPIPWPGIARSSGESTREHGKLKKRPGTSGLKALFSKKKSETASRSSVDSTSAAAASEGRPSRSGTLTPKGIAARRLSIYGQKQSSEEPSTPVTPNSPTPPIVDRKPTPVAPPAPVSDPTPDTYDGPSKSRREAEFNNLSRVNTAEQAEADHHFSNFDHQSPIVDQPAFLPVDTPTAESFSEKSPTPQNEKPVEPSPVNGRTAPSSPVSSEQPMPLQDRWAQIRKNAVERAGVVEDPTPKKTVPENPTTDDPTQQSIELRAARIRARVAELTKNMEASR
ncbi:morphogenesis protein Msb1 [Coccidioides posadasii str. Silveira]|uniref:Morphogenesis protein Msb1 n=1 Tax=Coccidioides posadasii (strain RMSCC 757 / Silveira) TaxID=443226 RepID=E9DHY7_COCPS|nr:morphogenesis protein Msb1 [Coccidioides posadasii str. Silveira]